MERAATMARVYGGIFLIAFVLSVVMLQTDTNLRTDFGSLTSGYYAHWYGVLATAIVDLIGALVLIVRPSRLAVKIGTAGSGLLALGFVGIVFTYAQVGFTSAGDFANYLFGVTYYGGDIRYLYDLLLAVYVLAFLFGLGALWGTRAPSGSAPNAS